MLTRESALTSTTAAKIGFKERQSQSLNDSVVVATVNPSGKGRNVYGNYWLVAAKTIV